MTETKPAQEWLENKYGKLEQKVKAVAFKEIKIKSDNEEEKVTKLEGEMRINGNSITSLTDIEKVDLYGAKGITKLIIEGCSGLTEVNVYGNSELTEIAGLENLPNLIKLNCGDTKINKIDISQNAKSREFYFTKNTQTKITGFGKVVKNLIAWNSFNGIAFPWEQIPEEYLKEIAEAFGIKKEEIEGEDVDKVKEIIKGKAEKVRKNEEKIKEKLPELINNEDEIVDNKLDELENLNKNKGDVVKEIKELKLKNEILEKEVILSKGEERLTELFAQIEVSTSKI